MTNLFKFEIGQKVWIMINNKPEQVSITARRYQDSKLLRAEITYVCAWGKHGSAIGDVDERQIFSTKEKLIKSL